MSAGESRASARTPKQRAHVEQQKGRWNGQKAPKGEPEPGPAWWTCPAEVFYDTAHARQHTIAAKAVPVYGRRDLS
jgi:hypothetical protein